MVAQAQASALQSNWDARAQASSSDEPLYHRDLAPEHIPHHPLE